ncbi:MAG: hypothetical protein EKK53_17035 [Burkholderiales bacterium]|nr:MAG: hypothetical protein EKK53_17035 [Burkholderiales bacterium]
MNYDTQHRNAAVLHVLNEATGPMTPNDIASKINEPWCCDSHWGGYPMSAPISAILKRICAVKVKRGQWLKPAA